MSDGTDITTLPAAADPSKGHPATADGLASRLFSLLRDTSEVDRNHVLLELRRHTTARAPGCDATRVEVARLAVARFTEENDGSPIAKARYEAWRSAHDDRASIPSSTFLMTTFGASWAKVTDALGLGVAPDHLVRRLTRQSTTLSDEQLLDSLRRCAAALDLTRLKWAEYHSWAVQELLESGREACVIVSSTAFTRRFGSWAIAQHKAGLDVEHGHWFGPRARTMTDEELLDCLRRCARALGVTRPRISDYSAWREREIQAAFKAGSFTSIPQHSTICNRFSGWCNALHAAALITDAQRKWSARGQGRQACDEHVAWSICESVRALGQTATQDQYTQWSRGLQRDTDTPTPVSMNVLRFHFGRYATARAAAVAVVAVGGVDIDVLASRVERGND